MMLMKMKIILIIIKKNDYDHYENDYNNNNNGNYNDNACDKNYDDNRYVDNDDNDDDNHYGNDDSNDDENYDHKDDNYDDTQGSSTVPYPRAIYIFRALNALCRPCQPQPQLQGLTLISSYHYSLVLFTTLSTL